ncbi:MAG: hypothetical protein ACYC8T_04535 [Myxococcaceae bacterium]
MYDSEGRSKGNQLELEYRLKSTADRVSAADFSKHLAAVTSIRKELGYVISLPAPQSRGSSGDNQDFLAGLGCMLVGLLAMVGLVVWIRRSDGDGPTRAQAPAALEVVVLAEQPITRVGRRCGTCQDTEARYFKVPRTS